MNKWIEKKGRYTFDRRIFLGVLALIITYFLFMLLAEGFTLGGAYLSCPETAFAGFCDNPFPEWCYNREPIALKLCGDHCESTEPICIQERIIAGESVGEQPGFFYSWYGLFSLFTVAGGFLLNHLLYNRGIKWEE